MANQNSLFTQLFCAFFFTFIFLFLVNLTSALKALFLFLDYNVRMLCDFNSFLYIIYAYMVTFTYFLFFLIQIQNTEIYTANQSKNTEIWIYAHVAQH